MILLTGAAGFIGSCLLREFNDDGVDEILLSDDFTRAEKARNYAGKQYAELIPREELDARFRAGLRPDYVVHIGARTDTTERDEALFERLNSGFTMMLWNWCVREGIPFIYASSAATYGDGSLGFSDAYDLLPQLQPLNPYGWSKHRFDLWAIEQRDQPPFWAGLKFFNVYGPNEYHKGRMASVIFHAFLQIRDSRKMKLFRSHRLDFADGAQARDFIYVKDVTRVIRWLMEGQAPSGIYNLGSGKARTFNDLAGAVFSSLDLEPVIEYIDTPADIRDSYQYFTEADMSKLVHAGYAQPFTPLESGVDDYVRNFLRGQEMFEVY